MEKVPAFIRLTRPVFLLGGFLLYAVGAALSEGPIEWAGYAAGQAMVTAIQLAAQYANEYFDVAADRLAGPHRTWLTGGSGVLSVGHLPPRTALQAAVIATIVSLVFTGVVAGTSPWAASIGLLALVGSWLYSAPPVRLVGTLSGVTAASVIVAILTVLAGALMQGSAPVGRVAVVALPLFLLHNAMLIAFERPDVAGDTAAGKRTLSVRLGPVRSARLHGGFIAGAYAALMLAIVPGPLSWSEAGWAMALAPLGFVQVWWFPRVSDTLLATVALGLFAGTALALLFGMA